MLLALRAPSTRAKVAWWTLLLLVPLGVALTRMYRGMHHPSDVLASFLNGGTCVADHGPCGAATGRALGAGPKLPTVRRPADGPAAASHP